MNDPFRFQKERLWPQLMGAGTSWYYAANYLDQEQAKTAWQRVHSVAKQHSILVVVRRVTYKNLLQVVIVHAPRQPDEVNQQRIIQALGNGMPVELPPALREEMETQQISVTPGERSRALVEFAQTDVERHLETLKGQFPYFIDFYQQVLPYNLSLHLKAPNGEEYLTILRDQLKLADIYEFTETARAMHRAVFDEELSWIPWQQDIWLQHDQADPLFNGASIKAIFVNKVDPLQVHEEYRHPWWNVTAVNPLGQHLLTMFYNVDEQTYDPTSDYICPWNACVDIQREVEGGYVIARQCCTRCRERADSLAKWLHTALRMLRRDFAISANPRPFEKAEMIVKRKQTIPRHHGKGKPKERVIEQKRIYTIVSYEVSLAEQREASPTESEGEKRQSWLSLHGKEHRIYKLLSVPDYERDYTGPYWERLIARCLEQLPPGQPGPVILDGVEYQVTFAGDGTPVVTRTINVPNGRYTPYLKAEYKKQPTVKKTVARRFAVQAAEQQQPTEKEGG